MPYTCPVCGYPKLSYPPEDYEICPSCGTEFEYHDARRSHEALTAIWMSAGMTWHSRVIPKPDNWDHTQRHRPRLECKVGIHP